MNQPGRLHGLILAAALLFNAAGASTPAQAQTLSRGDTPPIPTSYFGMHFHRIGGETAWPAARIGTWRLWDAEVNWWNLEPRRGQWDFSTLDRYVGEAAKRNVTLLLPLGAPPPWASARPNDNSPYNPGASAEPADIRDWQNYVRTVATRYKGRIYNYELWNEVNESMFYTGSVEMLVTLAQEARRILKEVDPTNKLVGPSVVGQGTEVSYLDRFLAAGGGNAVDVLAYHLYVPKNTPEAMIPLVQKVRTTMAKNNVDKRLWNTETGWSIDNTDGTAYTMDSSWKQLNQQLAAGYVVRSLVLGWVLGIDRFYWYAWDNYAMGFVDPKSRQTKLAGRAYANTVTLLGGARIAGCSPSASIWTCELVTAAGRDARILWNAADTTTSVVLPVGWTTGTHLYAPEGSLAGTNYGRATLDVGPIPRLLVKK